MAHARLDGILDLLRADGGRITTGRRAIVEALVNAENHHVTADDLAAAVHADYPDVHLTTVYRTLDALERLGAVARLNLGPGGAVYHLADHAHHHLVCDRCGTVTEIEDDIVGPWTAQLHTRYGYAVEPQHLVVFGRCPSCAAG